APRFDAIFLTRSSNERSLEPRALAAMLPAAPGPAVFSHATPRDAVAAARAWLAAAGAGARASGAAGGPLIVAAGSTFLVGDIRADVLGERRDPLPTSDPVSAPNR
ncbi:MAG: hypothetical protein ABUR63_08030, partial [Verrucomicrobiota bacterium]